MSQSNGNGKTHQSSYNSIVHFFSGGIAGCCAKSAIAPFDRVKIFFQTNNPHYPYTGVRTTMASVVRQEGFFHLWKGNTATLARIFPYASIQFAAYEQFKQLIIPKNQGKQPHPLFHTLCGSMAGATSTLLTYPLDLMRARLASQVKEKQYGHLLEAFATMYRKEGLRQMFKGLQPTLQGIIPYAGVNFGTFETLKFYAPKNDQGEVPTTSKLLIGGLAGAIGQSVSYPWDVIRRRMQLAGFAPGVGEIRYTGTWHAMREIARTEGILALYKGLSINFFKVVPSVGISFAVYETLKARLVQH